MSSSLEGTIVAAFGRHYEVELTDGTHLTGFPRGKKSPYACGDRVALERVATDQVQIQRHLPRTSLLYRSDAYREKLIAANATQIVLVVATEPSFSDELLTRALVAAESQGLSSIIVLNKADLAEGLEQALARLVPLQALGYPVIVISARTDAAPLLPLLAGELSVLVGQSGMGKSTLINALVPGATAATREISAALDSGKHTTTHARLYRLDHGGALIDSPGLQEFGLAHLPRGAIEQGFIEFRPHLDACRFRDCRHQSEPGCAIKQAVQQGRIDRRRFEQFLRLTAGH
ncbi:putative ribosome biogenesis GTPase RsgA [mine drainage metagenome]|uniref:Putative ribosome biogenesis GTPase RsgA n=1 Tax=mine drainage metagenome TaxID=410659 RepID=A0A1J5RAS0_9ZZZZ